VGALGLSRPQRAAHVGLGCCVLDRAVGWVTWSYALDDQPETNPSPFFIVNEGLFPGIV